MGRSVNPGSRSFCSAFSAAARRPGDSSRRSRSASGPPPAAPQPIRSFPPVADRSSRLLILGSMPGVASLRAGEYYAHPRNAFWRIIGELFGADPGAPYRERLAALRAEGIALWDVLASCTRAGSLDADIDDASIVANSFPGFLRAHPRIRTVCFNGAKAEAAFRRHVLPELGRERANLAFHRLPSTSPANASIPYARKLAAWRAACSDA